MAQSIKWFREISKEDIPTVGGKGANLGEMWNNNFPIPPGFVVTAQAYFEWLAKSKLRDKVIQMADSLDVENTAELEETSEKIRKLIASTKMGRDLEVEIMKAYQKIGERK